MTKYGKNGPYLDGVTEAFSEFRRKYEIDCSKKDMGSKKHLRSALCQIWRFDQSILHRRTSVP